MHFAGESQNATNLTGQSQHATIQKSQSSGSLSTRVPSQGSLVDFGRQAVTAAFATDSQSNSSLASTSQSKDSSCAKKLLAILLYARPFGGWWARVFSFLVGAGVAARYRKTALAVLMGIVARNGYFRRKAITKEILLDRINAIPFDLGDIWARDGTLLHWYASGPSEGPVVVLCNGIGCRVNFWAESIVELRKTYRVLMWDYRGTFRSGDPSGQPGQLSIHDHANDLEDIFAHLQISKAHAVLGWSMGVQVAIQFAATYAHRTEKLVLVTGSDKNVNEIALQPLFRIPGLSGVAPDIIRGVVEETSVVNLVKQVAAMPSVITALRRCVFKPWAMLYGSRDFEWIFARYFEEIYAPDIPHRCDMAMNYLRCAEELCAHSAHHLVPQLTQEVLVMTGMFDFLTPAHKSFEMQRRLQQSRLECWTFATHFIPCEFPDSFMQTLGTFLDAANLEEYDEWKLHGRPLQ